MPNLVEMLRLRLRVKYAKWAKFKMAAATIMDLRKYVAIASLCDGNVATSISNTKAW